MTSINLNQLPIPDVLETLDYKAILQRRKDAFIALWPIDQQDHWRDTLALESEPVTKLLEENAYLEILLRARINDAARATMLAYATGADLDAIGVKYHTTRLLITSADNTTTPPTPAVFESDEEYRERIQLAFEALSVAGPEQAYIWHARRAHVQIADVGVFSPNPAYVTVVVLDRRGNGQAQQEVLDAVTKTLNDETVRPIADHVTVKRAQIVNYSIAAQIYCYPQPEIEPIMQAARSNLAEYIKKQRRIGYDITLSGIYAALHVAGVQRVEITSPAADIEITREQCAHCTNSNVSYGGVDE